MTSGCFVKSGLMKGATNVAESMNEVSMALSRSTLLYSCWRRYSFLLSCNRIQSVSDSGRGVDPRLSKAPESGIVIVPVSPAFLFFVGSMRGGSCNGICSEPVSIHPVQKGFCLNCLFVAAEAATNKFNNYLARYLAGKICSKF